MPESKKTLVLAIDRDNDLGEKAKVKGPVIGEKDCLEAANALVLADPEDSDSNSFFAAVKTFREIEKSEVAVITGHSSVGIKSDEELLSQLKEVIKKVEPTEVIVVTDGAEDEYIMPIIQSFLPVVSVNRVIIKQSQNLESSYYMIKNFLHEIVTDPGMARMFLALPAVAILILVILGSTGWRLVLGAVGVYLLIRGLQLEIIVSKVVNELISSLKRDRISFFFYIVSVIFGAVAVMYGYEKALPYGFENWIMSALAFINGSIFLFFVAGFFIWMAKTIMFFISKSSEAKAKEAAWRYVTVLSLFFAITIVSYTSTEFLLGLKPAITDLLFSIALGFVAITLSVLIERLQKRGIFRRHSKS